MVAHYVPPPESEGALSRSTARGLTDALARLGWLAVFDPKAQGFVVVVYGQARQDAEIPVSAVTVGRDTAASLAKLATALQAYTAKLPPPLP